MASAERVKAFSILDFLIKALWKRAKIESKD
jgi:hypothetical protein